MVSKNDLHKERLKSIDKVSGISVDTNKESTEMISTTKLSDGSFLSVILGGKLGGIKYLDIDRVTLQIFVQLFNNAYYSFLLRRKKSNLSFRSTIV